MDALGKKGNVVVAAEQQAKLWSEFAETGFLAVATQNRRGRQKRSNLTGSYLGLSVSDKLKPETQLTKPA